MTCQRNGCNKALVPEDKDNPRAMVDEFQVTIHLSDCPFIELFVCAEHRAEIRSTIEGFVDGAKAMEQ